MERQEYLRSIWSPYPSMPDDYLAVGRIRALDVHDNRAFLVLEKEGQLLEFFDLPAPSWALSLQEGDILVLITESKWLLLAPSLKSSPRNFPLQVQQQWGAFLNATRKFFLEKNFLELKTPTLVVCPGTEPTLDVFKTELKIGSHKRSLYLPTSPEIHLKKTLAMGAERVFEIAPCFRNGELTEKHQPEFLMLEWYRAYANLNDIKQDVLNLVNRVCAELEVSLPKRILSYTVADLFQMYCGFLLKPDTSEGELRLLAEQLQVDVRAAESIDDVFFLIFIDKIESQFDADDLVFVESYPPYQAALARVTSDGWGDRFEFYWKGLELGNAFNELNDPKIQRLRSAEDLEKKKNSGKDTISLDEEFFDFLEAGMPPSGGIAVGLERLFMAVTRLGNLSDVRLFPYKK